MASNLTVTIKGAAEFERAVQRNPTKVKVLLHNFFVKAKALYTATVIRNPWQVGGSGGGAPVGATQALRDSHQAGTQILPFSMKYGPKGVPYAGYVHEGTYKMTKRPWLDYAFKQNDGAVRGLARDLLKDIVKDLAR